MDQITDLSLPVPAPTEPGAYQPQAATATAPTPNHNLPSYPEMIITTINALGDKDGSSRQAIAKYIERVYHNLPPNHNTFLTYHLKQMKNCGQLIMIKHSYALPSTTTRSDHFSFAGDFSSPLPAPSPSPVASNNYPSADASNTGSKRKPGRPPKAKSDPVDAHVYSGGAPGYQPEYPPYSMGASGLGPDVQGYSMGAPVFGSDVQVQPYTVGGNGSGHDVQQQQPQEQPPPPSYHMGGHEPMFVSLGLDDGPVAVEATAATPVTKRGRGRPPKGSGSTNGSVGTVVSGGSSETALGKRARDEPAKPRSITEMLSNGGIEPTKATEPVIVPLADGSPGKPNRGTVYSGKPRGRPRKIVNGAPARVSSRPPRFAATRKLYGKPMGRPRKNPPVTGVLITDPKQLVAYQELKTKYENIQIKVKQTASVVRPWLNQEDAISALRALQELEALATVGIQQ